MITSCVGYVIVPWSSFSLPQVGSPSALSDTQLEHELRTAAKQHGKTLYVPSGALWGGQDIQKMNDNGTLRVRPFYYNYLLYKFEYDCS